MAQDFKQGDRVKWNTPQGDLENSKWRYSLMNWGHDPLKE